MISPVPPEITRTNTRRKNLKKKWTGKEWKIARETFIKERGGKCEWCGSTERLTVHHIRSRRHSITRWNLENGICLSWRVHFLQKANPELFHDKIIECIGQKEYDRLKKLSNMTYKFSLDELLRIKEQLQEAIDK